MWTWFGPTAAASMSLTLRSVTWQTKHSRPFACAGSRRGYPLSPLYPPVLRSRRRMERNAPWMQVGHLF